MLRLFGIMLGLSVVENGIIFFYHACDHAKYDCIDFRFYFAWFFLKGLWLILVYFYVKATSNRDLMFKDTFMAVSYAMAFDLPITVLSLLGAVLVIILSLAGAGMIAFGVQFILGLITFVLALYYILLFTWIIPPNVKDHINAYYYHCYCIYCTFNKCIYDVTSIGESYFINIKQYNT